MKAFFERRALLSEHGQMTVELCVFLPVAIVVALIAVNAATFFGNCAEFDREARNAVRIHATSPAENQGSGETVQLVKNTLDETFSDENLECEVSVSSDYRGFDTYEMTLSFSPTLFGIPFRGEVFGVTLPALKHHSRLTVSPYKPGASL